MPIHDVYVGKQKKIAKPKIIKIEIPISRLAVLHPSLRSRLWSLFILKKRNKMMFHVSNKIWEHHNAYIYLMCYMIIVNYLIKLLQ